MLMMEKATGNLFLMGITTIQEEPLELGDIKLFFPAGVQMVGEDNPLMSYNSNDLSEHFEFIGFY